MDQCDKELKICPWSKDFIMSKKFIRTMIIYHCDENDQYDENALLWLKGNNLMKTYWCDENSSKYRKVTNVKKICHCDKNCSIWCRLIDMTNNHQ